MHWIDQLFESEPIEYLPDDFCKDKTNRELIEKLKSEKVSRNSGNMIILELLERLCKRVEKEDEMD